MILLVCFNHCWCILKLYSVRLEVYFVLLKVLKVLIVLHGVFYILNRENPMTLAAEKGYVELMHILLSR
jgi:hypothetical protein